MAAFVKAIQAIPGIASNGYKHLANVAGRQAAVGLLAGGAVGAAKGMLDNERGNFIGSTIGGAALGGVGGFGYGRLVASGYGVSDLYKRYQRSQFKNYINLSSSSYGSVRVNPEIAKQFPGMLS